LGRFTDLFSDCHISLHTFVIRCIWTYYQDQTTFWFEEIDRLIDLARTHAKGMMTNLDHLKSSAPSDFIDFTSSDKDLLAGLVNHAHSLSVCRQLFIAISSAKKARQQLLSCFASVDWKTCCGIGVLFWRDLRGI
jgi:hypothetical protein